MNIEDHQCACSNCDATGEVVKEKDCGCCRGRSYHTVNFSCGVHKVECDRCNPSGEVREEGDCEVCSGSGLDHDEQEVGTQSTFEGGEVDVYVCRRCEQRRYGDVIVEEGEP